MGRARTDRKGLDALRVAAVVAALVGALLGSPAHAAAEFRSASEAATVLYDAPSQKAKPIAIVGRDYPLEVLVSVEGWLKVRDASGALAWVEKRSVSDRRTVMVRAPVADVHSAPEAGAPIAFRAEQNVLLAVDEGQVASAPPGWIPVRHRDGQGGFVRVQQVWGY